MGKRTMFGKKKIIAPPKRSFRDRAVPAVTDTAAKAVPALVAAKAAAGPALADARERATPYLVDARDRATPYLTDARDKAAPMLADVRDRLSSDVLPVLTSAIAALDSATEDARAEARARGAQVVAAFKPEPPAPVKRKRRLSNTLIALGLGGVAFAVTKKVAEKQSDESGWQTASTTTTTSAPTTTTTGGSAGNSAGTTANAASVSGGSAPGGPGSVSDLTGGDTGRREGTDILDAGLAQDTAASDPAEAAADATEVPHVNSTPDNPVTSVDIDPDDRPRGL